MTVQHCRNGEDAIIPNKGNMRWNWGLEKSTKLIEWWFNVYRGSLLSCPYNLRRRLYEENAPGGISVISFCSSRLQTKIKQQHYLSRTVTNHTHVFISYISFIHICSIALGKNWAWQFQNIFNCFQEEEEMSARAQCLSLSLSRQHEERALCKKIHIRQYLRREMLIMTYSSMTSSGRESGTDLRVRSLQSTTPSAHTQG